MSDAGDYYEQKRKRAKELYEEWQRLAALGESHFHAARKAKRAYEDAAYVGD